MLEYENQMFLEALQEDGLMVSAKGLSLETVFLNILKVYSDPGYLVLILGTNDYDEEFFMDKLKEMEVKNLPKIITANTLSNEREIMYLEGGVMFISGRILVVDLLKNRVPLNLVTGILIWRSHNIMNSYQEAFSLRLYRKTNKTGFIKAFTNSALALTVGFSQVERIMKTLFVKHLYLWPRFHTTVNSSLSNNKPEVIELHVKLTKKMISIQTALLDIMNFIVKELKRLNKYLDLDDLTVENSISKKFHKQLQNQLDPIWHQLGGSTKQLVADLKLLGIFLMQLTQETSVSFLASLNRLRTMEYAMKCSGWLMLDVVEDLFVHARSRVYNNKKELFPEPCPKWSALSEILNEVKNQINKGKDNSENSNKVLILVYDGKTCTQLKNYLTMGPGEYLLWEAMRCLKSDSIKSSSSEKESNNFGDSEQDEEIFDNDSYMLTYTERPTETNNEQKDGNFTQLQDCSQMPEQEISNLQTTEPLVIIRSVKRGGDPMGLQRTLHEHTPSYVVMYGADISSIRQLEVYQNHHPSINLKIYFVIYGGSVEEQGYLTSLRREKEAFEKLINTKQTMVVPTDQDGKLDIADPINETEEKSSRKGASEPVAQVIPKVIVDIREFRSELPALLHKRGIEIEPVTIVIGDYILTPEICVERKSISDLIGSLNSGRLYNQCVSMSRYYAKPMLLIEFDQNKSFCLQGNYYVSRDMRSSDITAKLQLLTIHFPRLKLVWSPSPTATAQLFEELKQGKPQPDGQIAAQIGLDEDVEDKKIMAEKYNVKIQDLIAKLPGVHTKNLRTVLNHGVSLDHLIQLSQEELGKMLENKNDALSLYQALHDKSKSEEGGASATTSKAATKVKNRGLFAPKKKN